MNWQSKKYFFSTIAITTILIFFFYGKIIQSPNEYLFANTGDGFTAYYNTSWHIENDSSYTHFTGSNYPYGEHTVYSEYRLLISNSIKFLGKIFPSILEQNVAITNLSILLSILLCSIFIFLIFRKLGVKNWLVVTGAIGITFLAPQVGRFDNHLTLAYLNCIPMTWFFLIKTFEKSHTWKWSSILILNNLCWFFVHSYLGLIAAMFTGAFWLVSFLRNNDWKKITTYLHFSIQTFLPLLLFYSFVKITDTHEGRTENPLGFLLYNSEPDDIFIPHHPPLRPLLDNLFQIQTKWESWAYVGLLTTIVLLFLIVHFFKKGFQQKSIYPKLDWLQNDHLKIAFPAGVLCLIFAFGFPFKAFPQMLDWIPLIKNFRTTGRVGWIFYFISTVSVVYFLNEFLEKINRNRTSVFVLVNAIFFLPLTYFIEGYAHHAEMSIKTTQQKNVLEKKYLEENYLTAIQKINPKNYQAIIPLPYYHCGSEHFTRPMKDESSKISKIISYHTQLPLMAFDVGRTSIDEHKKMVQALSPTFYKKLITNDLESEKPFLIVASDDLSNYEKEIKNRSTIIYGTRDFQLMEISKTELLRHDSMKISKNFWIKSDPEYYETDRVSQSISAFDNTFTTNEKAFFFKKSFDDLKSEQTHFSSGALQIPKRGEYIIQKFEPNTFKKEKTYTLSAWFFNGQNDALNDWFRFIVEERNPKTGQFKYTTVFPDQSEVIDGDWSLVELDFQVDYPLENEIRILTIGKKWTLDISVYIDGLWIQEKGTDVFQNGIEHNGEYFIKKNNHIQKDFYWDIE